MVEPTDPNYPLELEWGSGAEAPRRQVLDGIAVATPPPSVAHQRLARSLFLALAPIIVRDRLGEVFFGPLPVRLSERTVVEPDLLFVARARRGLVDVAEVRGAPDLVIEVMAAETRAIDTVTKLRLYDRHGVREYWIFDPDLGSVKVYRRDRAHLVLAYQLLGDGGNVLTSPMLPGVAVQLDRVFDGCAIEPRR